MVRADKASFTFLNRLVRRSSAFASATARQVEPLQAQAGVAELADALDSKSSDRKIVWVRSPPPALLFNAKAER